MKVSRYWATALIGLGLFGGIVFTTPAGAQESTLSEAKDRARQAPMNADAALAYGRALRRAGRDNDALVELRRAQSIARGDAAIVAGWEVARTHIVKREFNPALAACKGIAKLPSGDAASHACAAEAHLLWRRGTEALVEVGEVAKIPGANAEVRYHAKVAEGRSRELDSKDDAAEAAYKEAINLAPNRPEAPMFLGAMLHRLGKDGVPMLKKAVDLDARDPLAQVELGRALAADPARRGEGIAAFERAIAERPSFVEAHRLLTEAYLVQNRLPDAKRTAAAVLKVAPNDVLAHVVSGRVALADGKTDEALKEGEAALKLMPNESKAKLLVADTYAKKGEIDLALEAYQKASGLDPLDPTPLVTRLWSRHA